MNAYNVAKIISTIEASSRQEHDIHDPLFETAVARIRWMLFSAKKAELVWYEGRKRCSWLYYFNTCHPDNHSTSMPDEDIWTDELVKDLSGISLITIKFNDDDNKISSFLFDGRRELIIT